jgi:predicted DNA-binding transcriptional regulator YafY
MRRADRLFLIIHALRGRRTALQARQLAETLAVSLRTIYRDVADLQLSGVPIEGEAGVGYVLRKGADIPPLMFTAAEIESLVVGTRFVRAFAGEKLADGAQAALLKIEAVLPPELRERSARTRIYAPIWRGAEQAAFAARIDQLHAAIDARHVLQIVYRTEAGEASTRQVEPLCLAFWGGKWTLGTWCRLRSAFRNFRPDRVEACAAIGERFEDVPNRNFDSYLQAMRGHYAGMD